MTGAVHTIYVRFKRANGGESEKTYPYMTRLDLEKDDVVIVDSPYGGYTCVRVEDVHRFIRSEKATMWVVQKVDDEQYKQALANEERMRELEMQIEQSIVENKKLQKYEEVAADNPNVRTLLNELKELKGLKTADTTVEKPSEDALKAY